MIEQAPAGNPHSVSGGYATASIAEQSASPTAFVKKNVAGVKYEDITVTCGAGMSKAFWTWVADTMGRKTPSRNGSVDLVGFDNKPVSQLTYANALISQITFPTLDASIKEPAFFTVVLTPESTRRGVGKGTAVAPRDLSKQKAWVTSNFKLDIPGLDTSRVSRIESFTFKQKTMASTVGVQREPTLHAASWEVPNLVVTINEAGAADWYAWYQSFFVEGRRLDENEKSGTLTFLAPDLQTTYMKLSLKHIGLAKFTPDKVEAGGEAIRRVRVEMYVEEMSLDVDGSAAF